MQINLPVHSLFVLDIDHTRGPLDGSLYAQIKKRRGPISGSLNSTTTSSPRAGLEEDHLMGQSSNSALSGHFIHINQLSTHRDHQEEPNGLPPPTKQEREELDRLLGGIEDTQDKERETAILDDDDSLPSGTLRLNQSYSCWEGYRSQHCAEPGYDCALVMPNGYCLDQASGTNGHHGTAASASPNLASPPSHMDLCQHYSPHSHQSLPPPDLVWDRKSSLPHYVHHCCSNTPSYRHIDPYQSPDLTPHSNSHTHAYPLSAPGRIYCREDNCSPYHLYPLPYSSHTTHPHPPKGSASPAYNDMNLIPPPECPCRNCSIRHEDSVACQDLGLVRSDSFHLGRKVELQKREGCLRRTRETKLPREGSWERDPGLKRGRQLSLQWEGDREADLHWKRDRETDYWHSRATVASYSPHAHYLPGYTLDPLPSGHPAHPEASRSHGHSQLDLKYGSSSSSSSTYQTLHQMCPCSPYQPSPAESRGYASSYQSESTSQLPPGSSMSGPCSHSSGPAEHNRIQHHQRPDTQQSYCSDSCPGELFLNTGTQKLCFSSTMELRSISVIYYQHYALNKLFLNQQMLSIIYNLTITITNYLLV